MSWKAADVLDFEDKYHSTRKRKIDVTAAKGAKEEVYVFRVFADEESVDEILADIKEKQEKEAKHQKKLQKKSNLLALLDPKEDDHDDEPA